VFSKHQALHLTSYLSHIPADGWPKPWQSYIMVTGLGGLL